MAQTTSALYVVGFTDLAREAKKGRTPVRQVLLKSKNLSERVKALRNCPGGDVTKTTI